MSDDERLVRVLEKVGRLVQEAETDYAVIGSCGLQAYLSCFYRLPNDLDLVVPEAGTKRLVLAAQDLGAEFVEQLGRGQLIVDGFPVHLIPSRMAVIDKDVDHIFTSVDLSDELSSARERRMKLVGAARVPSLRVASLESILFIEMVRPIYTGSAMSIALTLRDNDFNDERMSRLLRENPELGPVLLDRVERLPAVIRQMTVLAAADRDPVQDRLCRLARVIRVTADSFAPPPGS
ncbi:MAG TPA: hypothetical protein VFM94_07230 [Solirubrobacterales bacterium]|nr:hypothetical protein [Solirubrobacterales bacterium]